MFSCIQHVARLVLSTLLLLPFEFFPLENATNIIVPVKMQKGKHVVHIHICLCVLVNLEHIHSLQNCLFLKGTQVSHVW